MKEGILREAVALAEKVGHIFVATSDARGLPHMAAAGRVAWKGPRRVAVEAWFCPGTLANLQGNSHISLVVWDSKADQGYQLLGEAEKVEDLAMLDGYAPSFEKPVGPQAERRLFVRVERALEFQQALHSDAEA